MLLQIFKDKYSKAELLSKTIKKNKIDCLIRLETLEIDDTLVLRFKNYKFTNNIILSSTNFNLFKKL